MEVKDLTIGIMGEKTKRVKLTDIRFVKLTRLWLAYNQLVEWMGTDAGGISDGTAALIGNCAVRQCDPLAELGIPDLDLGVPEWDASIENVREIVDDSIDSLNDNYMNPIDMNCSYTGFEYAEVLPEQTSSVTLRNDYCSCLS